MAQQSLKNLDSFSRGYIEDVRSKVDFDTTLRARSSETIVNSTTITLSSQPVSVLDGSVPAALVNPIVGKVMSGTGIVGVPRVTDISDDRLTITFDQPQTFGDVDGLTINFVFPCDKVNFSQDFNSTFPYFGIFPVRRRCGDYMLYRPVVRWISTGIW